MEERDNNQNASMVFTLQDEHNALPDAHEQDAWETAPHDWCEPETTPEDAIASAHTTTAADDGLSDKPNDVVKPAEELVPRVDADTPSMDDKFADDVASAAFDALNQAENDSQDVADEAPSEPAIIRDPAAVP
ncbi:hypothetical protein, partial [Conchiformibius steedae]|uniref:hypothetical protein n=1 Tax=Conchiformibius steedae TaxID=153493 RepID=UPI0026EF589C